MASKKQGTSVVATEADSVKMLQICQDVTIGKGDRQLIK